MLLVQMKSPDDIISNSWTEPTPVSGERPGGTFIINRKRAAGRERGPLNKKKHGSGQGANVVGKTVHYRTWSEHRAVAVLVVRPDGSIIRSIPLSPEGNGYFNGVDADGRAGDLYKYEFDHGTSWPDPASRCQPLGVHAPSMVIDPGDFEWSDESWRAPSFTQLIIYELHIGTFTPEGTFNAAATKLDYLANLGVTAIELMPLGDFPGDRNWGYDGVMIYAPARVYGSPDDLRRLVNAAHARGIAIILDVVYNHLGPDGNYLGLYSKDYFHPTHQTPWGAAFNFERSPVRDFFVGNISYWIREFHVDGFRLDATHAIEDHSEVHVLAEIAAAAHAEGVFVIAEDERNDPLLLSARDEGGLDIDACWADDFHHVAHVMLTGEKESYYANYEGTSAELATTLRQGWLFTGQTAPATGKPRGGDPRGLSPAQFVYCIDNHDQVGNRAFGERLEHLVSSDAYRALSALLCLSPYTPLLFMGQEWSASSRFQYFTDHEKELGKKITRGRREEFREFSAFAEPESLQKIPDPQKRKTFLESKLRWSECKQPAKAGTMELYRECLRLRRRLRCFENRSRSDWQVIDMGQHLVGIIYGALDKECCLLVADLTGRSETLPLPRTRKWHQLFSSNDPRFLEQNGPANGRPITVLLQAS